MLRPSYGSVRVAGQALSALAGRQLAQFRTRHIGVVFQDFPLIVGYSSLENAQVAGVALPESRRRAKALLERLEFARRLHHVLGKPSIGERQRVAIAHALAGTPLLLLADEPTANLFDRARDDTALQLLREVASQYDATLIVSAHDPPVKKQFVRRLELT